MENKTNTGGLVNFTWLTVTGFLVCVIIALLCARCDDERVFARNLGAARDSVQYFVNRDGMKTATIQTMALEADEMQAALFDKDAQLRAMKKEFARVKHAVKTGTVTDIRDIGVQFDEPIVSAPCDSIGKFERTGTITHEWYTMKYRVTNDSLQVPQFTTHTETAIMTGIKRKWFLGKETYVTDVTNTNPYITVTGITSAELTVPQPWYKKWYVWGAAGVMAGIFIAK